jgi:cellulose synthase/poly-beta-1,6-N-acetylglucosamine synthase-like glycosyltransferase
LPLLIVFFTASTGIWLYSFSRWKNLLVSIYCFYFEPSTDDTCPPDLLQGKEPHVTVQICTYNEAHVVEETISRCCKLDWPLHKLSVQICDDSTEKESITIIENCVLRWREKGFAVSRHARPNRIGYKAGNLNHNFPFVEGEFVAYLDADHQITADFLRKTVPHFYDANGVSNDHIGLVQTPWSYYNTHENLLTECDALGLDIHHVVEQVGRHRAHGVFGFNGTGGVWRKEAIQAAGLFSSDTVTEDLLLSYKAYLAGYDFHYVRTAPQQLEVPGNFLAHIQQKQRWTKGFIQVLWIFYGEVLVSPNTPFQVKLEAFLHLCGPLQLIMTALVFMVYPYLVYHQIDSLMVKAVSVSAIVEPVASALHALTNKVPGENGYYNLWWSRLLRLTVILPYFALRFGMSAFEVKAVLEGFFSDDATFLTTPKAGLKNNICERTNARKIKVCPTDDLTAFAGLCLAFHQTIYVFALDGRLHGCGLFDIFIRAMNMIICIGLYWVNSSFLITKYCNHLETLCMSFSQQKQRAFGVVFIVGVNCFMVMTYSVSLISIFIERSVCSTKLSSHSN